MGLSGLAKRASRWADCLLRGERARFFVGWPLRGSRWTGMDSGMFSDMVVYLSDEAIGEWQSAAGVCRCRDDDGRLVCLSLVWRWRKL
jgi:hypothetical protein